MLIGQTGNIPPISSVQPQQCHLVGFPHITQHRTALNGSCMDLLWCFESGRMGFALSSIGLVPCSDAWNAWPIFQSMVNGLTLQNMILSCYVCVHDCKGIKQDKTDLKKEVPLTLVLYDDALAPTTMKLLLSQLQAPTFNEAMYSNANVHYSEDCLHEMQPSTGFTFSA